VKELTEVESFRARLIDVALVERRFSRRKLVVGEEAMAVVVVVGIVVVVVADVVDKRENVHIKL